MHHKIYKLNFFHLDYLVRYELESYNQILTYVKRNNMLIQLFTIYLVSSPKSGRHFESLKTVSRLDIP